MFAVVALRSTTVLATMESVSGDTAVDHGGDVAHIRGRKLLALLPERYEAHPEFSCAGRNELGMLTLSLAECAAKCEEYPTCISFDFNTPTADWTSTSAYSCNLSETCTKELAATDLAHTLFVKLPATTVFLSAKLTAGDGAVEDMFGNNVMIDGDTIVIAANYDDDKGSNSGSAYVFTRTIAGDLTSGWTQVAKLTAGDGAVEDYFGQSVSIDGDTVVIGAIFDDDKGPTAGPHTCSRATQPATSPPAGRRLPS